MDYDEAFSTALKQIKTEKRYRVFTPLEYLKGNFPLAYAPTLGKNITVWCSNNYLGMSQHPEVINALCESAQNFGVSAGGTRNISGTHTAIEALEKELASLHDKESALVFTSGYNANQAAIAAIGKIIPDCVIFSDADNHASIIHGIKNSSLTKEIFRHNDTQHLEELIKKYPLDRPKIIIFESVYSMSGTIAPFIEILKIAKRYNAITYVDEVHAVGMYGAEGQGMASVYGVADEMDIIQGTLGKAFGVIGGYIAGKKVIVDAIRSIASGFIFTTALPPCIAAAATTSIRYLKKSNIERQKQQQVVKVVKDRLDALGISFIRNNTHIISILVKDPEISRLISSDLLHNFSIYVQNINFPTVPRGKERLRITPTPMHTNTMIDELIHSLGILHAKYTLN